MTSKREKGSAHRESGSALWLILMAIALLAALAIAITRSSGTAEQNGGIEHNRISASQLLRYASGLGAAIDRMRMNGVSENTLDFDTTGLTGYANANCTTDDCKVFATNGGAQVYNVPSGLNDGGAWIFTGALAVPGAGDDANNELLAILPGLSQTLCQEIDNEAGPFAVLTTSSTIASTATPFTGTYAAVNLITGLPGKQAGCAEDSGGTYFFYDVLLAR